MFSTTAQTPSICSSNSELYRLIKSRAINNDIVVSFSNFSFTDFALNWIKGLQQLKITNYLMFALDQNSYNFFVQRNICSYLIDKTDKLFTEESQNFGSLGFIAICNVKPWLVHELLKAGFNVVWSDTDIVWLRVHPLDRMVQFLSSLTDRSSLRATYLRVGSISCLLL
jgi:hypothetical protein